MRMGAKRKSRFACHHFDRRTRYETMTMMKMSGLVENDLEIMSSPFEVMIESGVNGKCIEEKVKRFGHSTA
jgi:hypothetical protein